MLGGGGTRGLGGQVDALAVCVVRCGWLVVSAKVSAKHTVGSGRGSDALFGAEMENQHSGSMCSIVTGTHTYLRRSDWSRACNARCPRRPPRVCGERRTSQHGVRLGWRRRV